MEGYRSLPIYGAFEEPFHISVKLANSLIEESSHDAMIIQATKDVINFIVSLPDESSYKTIITDSKIDNDKRNKIHIHGPLVICLTILLLAKRHGDILVSMETFHLKMYKLSASCTDEIKNNDITDKEIAINVVTNLKSQSSIVWYMIDLLKALKAAEYIKDNVVISISPGINIEGQTKTKTPAMIMINPVNIPEEWKNISTTATREMLTRNDTKTLHVANSGTTSSDYDRATEEDSDSDDELDIDEFEDEDYDSDGNSDINVDDSDYIPEVNNSRKKEKCKRLRFTQTMLNTYYCFGLNALPFGIGATFKPVIERKIAKLLGDIAKSTIGYQCYNVNGNAFNSGTSKNDIKLSTCAFNGKLSESKSKVYVTILLLSKFHN